MPEDEMLAGHDSLGPHLTADVYTMARENGFNAISETPWVPVRFLI